jgi:hypothetical protein
MFKQHFSRRRRYDELSQSIQEHLDETIADLVDNGMSLEEAARAARRQFGNVALLEERSARCGSGSRWRASGLT